MEIGPNKVVTIGYTLREDGGEVIDSSEGREPLVYLHGVGMLVPGLEKALDGRVAGDHVEVTLAPADGYGMRDERRVRNVPVRKIADGKAAVGARVHVEGPVSSELALVLAVRGDYATIDANHPLAGKTLHFVVDVVEVRDATADEQAHRHAHLAGHHHH